MDQDFPAAFFLTVFQVLLSWIKFLFAGKFLLAKRLSTRRPLSARKNFFYLVWHQNSRVSEVRQWSLVLKNSLFVVTEKRIRANQKMKFWNISSWSEKVEHVNSLSKCLIENFSWSFCNTFYNIVLIVNIVLNEYIFNLIMWLKMFSFSF